MIETRGKTHHDAHLDMDEKTIQAETALKEHPLFLELLDRIEKQSQKIEYLYEIFSESRHSIDRKLDRIYSKTESSLLSVTEAIAITGLSRRSIMNLISDEKVTTIRKSDSPKSPYMIDRASLYIYISESSLSNEQYDDLSSKEIDTST